MDINSRAKLERLSIVLILVAVAIVILGLFTAFLILLFDMKVFGQQLSGIAMGFLGLVSLWVAILAVLNVLLNFSIFAQSRLPADAQPRPLNLRIKWIVAGFGVAFALITIFAGITDLVSRKMEKSRILSESEELIRRYNDSFAGIGQLLGKQKEFKPTGLGYGSKDKDLRKIQEHLHFLSAVKDEFPNVTVIARTMYRGDTAYRAIDYYRAYYYKCFAYDCDYINRTLANPAADHESLYQSKGTNFRVYRLYRPTAGPPFVILLEKRNPYGRLKSDSYMR